MLTKKRLEELRGLCTGDQDTELYVGEAIAALLEVIGSHEVALRWIALKNHRIATLKGGLDHLLREYRKVEIQLIELEEERDAKK